MPGQVHYHVIVITDTTRLRVSFALFRFISCVLLSERKPSLKIRRDLHNRALFDIIWLVSFMLPFSPLTKSVSWIYSQRECLSCSSEKKLNHESHLIRVVVNKCISFLMVLSFRGRVFMLGLPWRSKYLLTNSRGSEEPSEMLEQIVKALSVNLSRDWEICADNCQFKTTSRITT